MRRRAALFALLCFGVGAAPRLAHPQARTVRIGFLAPRERSIFLPAIMKRLGELGYVEGRNLALDYRSADGALERYPALARELVTAKCDLVFASGTEHPARALIDTGTKIPIVLLAVAYDPVRAGIVSSLGRPGGNVTGMHIPLPELAAKNLEVLHDVVPAAKRILALGDAFTAEQLESAHRAAERLRLRILPATLSGTPPYDFDPAFDRARASGAEAVLVLDSPSFFDHRRKIADLAMKHRLPSAVNLHYLDQAAFFISYGADFRTAFARAGDIAASILKGARPGEIPVEQPAQFELAVNLSVAKALGVSIPGSVMARADRIIQ